MNFYNKLVRDRIPAIIAASGARCETRRLTESEIPLRLREKLQEEVAEVIASDDVEELADVMEVVYALAALKGVGPAELEAVRSKKRSERGGFEDGLLLVSVHMDAAGPVEP